MWGCRLSGGGESAGGGVCMWGCTMQWGGGSAGGGMHVGMYDAVGGEGRGGEGECGSEAILTNRYSICSEVR